MIGKQKKLFPVKNWKIRWLYWLKKCLEKYSFTHIKQLQLLNSYPTKIVIKYLKRFQLMIWAKSLLMPPGWWSRKFDRTAKKKSCFTKKWSIFMPEKMDSMKRRVMKMFTRRLRRFKERQVKWENGDRCGGRASITAALMLFTYSGCVFRRRVFYCYSISSFFRFFFVLFRFWLSGESEIAGRLGTKRNRREMTSSTSVDDDVIIRTRPMVFSLLTSLEVLLGIRECQESWISVSLNLLNVKTSSFS